MGNIDHSDRIVSKNKELRALIDMAQGCFQADYRDRAAVAGQIEGFWWFGHRAGLIEGPALRIKPDNGPETGNKKKPRQLAGLFSLKQIVPVYSSRSRPK